MRTEYRGYWAAVSQVALRFDSDILEVFQNGTVLVNSDIQGDSFGSLLLDEIYPVAKSGNMVTVSLSGAQSIAFSYNSRGGVSILMDAHGSDFYESRGMAGTWNKYGFNDRDDLPLNATINTRNAVEYAMVWEVNATLGDPLLLSTPPEHNCIDIPEGEDPPEPSPDEIAAAEKACAGIVLDPNEKGNCVFDVLNDGGVESVENNTAYTEPFGSTERCVAAPIPSLAPTAEAPPSCADLGGECVYRCDTSVNDCLQGPLCVENVALTVVDERRRSRRRMEFVEGCACRLPKQPSQSPSASGCPSEAPSDPPSGRPSEAPSDPPSGTPSQTPSLDTKKGKSVKKIGHKVKSAKKNA